MKYLSLFPRSYRIYYVKKYNNNSEMQNWSSKYAISISSAETVELPYFFPHIQQEIHT